MLKYIVLITFLWVLAGITFGVDMAELYQTTGAYLAAKEVKLCIWTGGGALAAFGLTYVFDLAGLHSVMYLFARLLVELSKLAIALFCLAALYIAFRFDAPFWAFFGYVSVLPFLAMVTALCCIRLFDFNYPIHDSLVETLFFPFLAGLVLGARAVINF